MYGSDDLEGLEDADNPLNDWELWSDDPCNESDESESDSDDSEVDSDSE